VVATAKDVRRPPGPNARKIKACDDRLRRRILRLLHLSSPLSPEEVARVLEEPIGRVGYQMKLHEALGTVELVREQQVRSAVEHFYASLVAEDELVLRMLDETREEDEAI